MTTRVDYDSKTKDIADQEVLDANNQDAMRTLCLRYGEWDKLMSPGYLRVLQEGRHRYQVGKDTKLVDFVSASNAATSHVLAVKALPLDPDPAKPGFDGEVFSITDDSPIPFWSFQRRIWSAAGAQAALPEALAWSILNLASTVEWLY